MGRKRALLAAGPAVLGCLIALGVGLGTTNAADSKEIITFQCRLVNSGVPVNATDLDLTFEVWSLETGGDPEDADERVHDEDHGDVTVTNGLLSVRLGEQGGNPLTGVFTKYPTLWVMVKITGGADLLPARIKLSAVPYSMNAARASSLMDASGSVFYTSDFLQSSTSGSETTVNGQQATLVIQASETDIATGTITLHGTIDVTNTLEVGETLRVGEVVELAHTSTPGGTAGHVSLYAKSDGLYYKNETGSEQQVGSGSGGGTTAYTINGFRLTAESDTPVPTSDVTSATAVYLVPYTSNEVWTKDSGTWTRHTASSQLTLDLYPESTAQDKNYDVFVYWTGSALALHLSAAWDDDNARADGSSGTDLVQEDGVWVKRIAGGATQAQYRYVGTIRTSGSANNVVDSNEQRFVWNVRNRVQRLNRTSLSGYYTLDSRRYGPPKGVREICRSLGQAAHRRSETVSHTRSGPPGPATRPQRFGDQGAGLTMEDPWLWRPARTLPPPLST